MSDIQEGLSRALLHYVTATGTNEDRLSAFLKNLTAQGLAIVPLEPTEEMMRAFCSAKDDGETDWDEMIPAHGTGQGDLQYVMRYQDLCEILSFSPRYKAMILNQDPKPR